MGSTRTLVRNASLGLAAILAAIASPALALTGVGTKDAEVAIELDAVAEADVGTSIDTITDTTIDTAIDTVVEVDASPCIEAMKVGAVAIDCGNPATCTIECCGSCPEPCAGVVCDNGPCWTSTCDPSTGGCTFEPTSGSCDDGDPCTVGDTCSGGICMPGAYKDCDDGDFCTYNWCDSGQCVSMPSYAPCDDGQICTTGDSCRENGCEGDPMNCDDGIECTSDSCEEPSGCVYVPKSSACSDDDNPCTQPVCFPFWGCGWEPKDGSCDDGNPCTDDDQCNGGACWGGPQKDCDDNNPCTDDFCDPVQGCVHILKADSCTECMNNTNIPPIQVSLGYTWPAKASCPGFFGGSAGVEVTVSGSAQKQFSQCPDCESSFEVGAALSVGVLVCKGNSFKVEGGGSYTGTTSHCVECDEENTCKLYCGDASCDQQKYTGFASATVSRFLGYQTQVSTGKVGPIPSISLLVKCGVDVGVTVGASGSYAKDTPGTCDPCPSCTIRGGSASIGGSASGGCYFRLSMFKGQVTLGCKSCASVGITFTGGGELKSGDCGASGCIQGSVSGNASASLPCWDVGAWWFKAAVNCSVGASGSCTAGCGKSGCGVDNVYASCTVQRGGCQ